MTAGHEPPLQTYRFTVAEVLRMVAAGFLADRRVELLDGELICMTAKGPLHILIAGALDRRLDRALPAGWHARKEEPLATSVTSAPEPDVSIVRGSLRDYPDRLPAGTECVLAVEVSVTTLQADRGKLLYYATGGVPEVWILDVQERRLERYTDPQGAVYLTRRVFLDTEFVDVPVIGERWEVGSLFD